MTNKLSSIMARDAIRPPFLAANKDLSESSSLHPGDRLTAHICGDFITGTVQRPDPDVFFGAERRGAEFSYSDRDWRVEFLADDGSLVCCHSDLCHAARGAA